MPEPKLVREGNLRIAGFSFESYPEQPESHISLIKKTLLSTTAHAYGPALLWFSLPPEDLSPSRWSGHIGVAITGLPTPTSGLLVEDYRNLLTLTLPHAGPIRDVAITWRRLADHAKRMTLGTPRPYWRLALRNRRMPDGNPLPIAELGIFLDR